MSYSCSHVLARAFILILCVSVALADCSSQPLFLENLNYPIRCEGDAGGTELDAGGNSISFKALLSGTTSQVEQLGVPLPDTLVLKIATFPNGRINKNASSVTVNGVLSLFGNDRDTFKTYFQVIQIIAKQYETGDCPIDRKNQRFPKIASLRGSLSTLAYIFGIIDCTGFIQTWCRWRMPAHSPFFSFQ